MAYPRKYSQDLIDSVVERVTEQRARRHHGAVTTVARELGLERRLVQAWVSEANRGAAHIPAPPLGVSRHRR